MNNEFVTVEQVMAELGCSQRTIVRKIEQGLLPPLPEGRCSLKSAWPKKLWDQWFSKQAEQIIDALKNEKESVFTAHARVRRS